MSTAVPLPEGLCHTSKDRAVEILSSAVQDDSFHRYVFSTWNDGSDRSGSVQTNRKFFNEMLSGLETEGVLYLSVPDSPLVMVCQLETVGGDTSDSEAEISADVPYAVQELEANSKEALERALPEGQEVLHLFLFGKSKMSQRGPTSGRMNSGREMLFRLIQLASLRNWPIYLEATSERSRDLFQSVGFEVVDEMRLGRGRVDQNGDPQSGGCGVSLWFALLRPEPHSD